VAQSRAGTQKQIAQIARQSTAKRIVEIKAFRPDAAKIHKLLPLKQEKHRRRPDHIGRRGQIANPGKGMWRATQMPHLVTCNDNALPSRS
jgi:hypothetical protein